MPAALPRSRTARVGAAAAVLAASLGFAPSATAGAPVPAAAPASAATAQVVSDVLTSGQALTTGQQVVSADGRYRLVLQADGNVVLYGPEGEPRLFTGSYGADGLRLQADGNLVAYRGARALWHSGTWRAGASRLQVRNDGAVVLTGPDGRVTWNSGPDVGWVATSPLPAPGRSDALVTGQVLAPGQTLVSANRRYRLAMQTDGNLVVYAPGDRVLWHAHTHGNPGARATAAIGSTTVTAADGRVLWEGGGAYFGAVVLQDDGNLVAAGWHSGWDRTSLNEGQVLTPGQQVTSPNGRYHLYVPPQGPVTVHGPGGRPVFVFDGPASTSALLVRSGDLELHQSRSVEWTALGRSGEPATLHVQDDGNVVLRALDGRPLWYSAWDTGARVTAPSDGVRLAATPG